MVGATLIVARKAFDTVVHLLLRGKLERYGAQNDQFRWFASCRSERKIFFRINGTDSLVNAVNIGVPQGSCLGSLYFLQSLTISLKS